jgi:hypothetical protein
MRMVEKQGGNRVSDCHPQTSGLAYGDNHDSARLITESTSSYTYVVSDRSGLTVGDGEAGRHDGLLPRLEGITYSQTALIRIGGL